MSNRNITPENKSTDMWKQFYIHRFNKEGFSTNGHDHNNMEGVQDALQIIKVTAVYKLRPKRQRSRWLTK
jgi:hypothetical protein